VPFRAVTVEGIALLCFPTYDTTFRTIVQRVFEQLEERTPDALQAALAATHPRVVVRPRADLATFGAASSAWYVYRDGRFSPFADGHEWWRDEACARVVVDEEGRYVDGNDAALRLMRLTRDELLASRAGDFSTERGAAVIPWVWELLRQTGELHSTSVLRARDGHEAVIEYHLTRDGGGPGRHLTAMREVSNEAAASTDGEEA
jgi:PAS domain-containing protein